MSAKLPVPTPDQRDWDGVLRREFDFECKAVDEQARSVDVIASTSALDSHGDVIEQDWDLKRYEKNPVVLWNHNRFDSSPYSMGGAVTPKDLLPIGRAENVRVEGGKLKATLCFASEKANPLAENVFQLFSEKIIRAVSVGFRPGKVTKETKNGREIYRLSECELREISAVPMGSNPEAVAKSIEFERENLALVAAKEKAMNEDTQKAIESANSACAAAQKSLLEEQTRAKALETELTSEKALSAKLEKELTEERAKLATASEGIAKSELDARQGVKFAPAERTELDALVKDIGIERVKKLLDTRGDLGVLKGVEVEGKPLERSAPAPEPVTGGDASGDLAKSAEERSKKG